uniref:Exostosin domain-containing protein n=1 Tax=Angiostrongylus cantonensis TaxID=6313 RepID=A0A0K0D9X5_ANGCA
MILGYRNLLTAKIRSGFKCGNTCIQGTHVLFLHSGLPRTEFYAKEFLKKSAAVYYQIPKKMENGKIRDCIAKYGESRAIEDSLSSFAGSVQSCLNTLVPEFDPVTCSNAFLFGEPSIEQELINVGRSDCSHIVLVPFYAHFSCAHSGFLLNEAARVLQKFTNPAFVNGKEVHYERIIPNSSNSFRVSVLHRWSSHSVVSEVCSSITFEKNHYNSSAEIFAKLQTAAITTIFSITYCHHRRSVWSTCERVMSGLNDRFPWRLGFFNAWDQWDLPVGDSLAIQVRLYHCCTHFRGVLTPSTYNTQHLVYKWPPCICINTRTPHTLAYTHIHIHIEYNAYFFLVCFVANVHLLWFCVQLVAYRKLTLYEK